MTNKTLKDWNTDDRPREKALLKGVSNLSDVELLAILVGKGTPDMNAVDTARELFGKCHNNFGQLAKLTIPELSKMVKGVGQVKAITIAVALEIARRREAEQPINEKVQSSGDAAKIFYKHMRDLTKEVCWVMSISSGRFMGIEQLSAGGVASTIVDPIQVFKSVMMNNATSFIVAHNHPSGNLKPSDADKKLTESLRSKAEIMNITMLDHLILTNNGEYYSFADNGLL